MSRRSKANEGPMSAEQEREYLRMLTAACAGLMARLVGHLHLPRGENLTRDMETVSHWIYQREGEKIGTPLSPTQLRAEPKNPVTWETGPWDEPEETWDEPVAAVKKEEAGDVCPF